MCGLRVNTCFGDLSVDWKSSSSRSVQDSCAPCTSHQENVRFALQLGPRRIKWEFAYWKGCFQMVLWRNIAKTDGFSIGGSSVDRCKVSQI